MPHLARCVWAKLVATRLLLHAVSTTREGPERPRWKDRRPAATLSTAPCRGGEGKRRERIRTKMLLKKLKENSLQVVSYLLCLLLLLEGQVTQTGGGMDHSVTQGDRHAPPGPPPHTCTLLPPPSTPAPPELCRALPAPLLRRSSVRTPSTMSR